MPTNLVVEHPDVIEHVRGSPRVHAVRRDAQPIGYVGHRMRALGYLLDRSNLELVRVPLPAHTYFLEYQQ